MPIPPFDHNRVLPAHLGDPTDPAGLSPYPATSVEVCTRFATSPERCAILRGWLEFRGRLATLGLTDGFQWLDGSFSEDVEGSAGRAPRDLDVVTFFTVPAGHTSTSFLPVVSTGLPQFFDSTLSKMDFHLDHYAVHLGASGALVAEQTRYWTALFSHRRDGVWKGMLRVELNTGAEDTAALHQLPANP
jgi:hypothetical protein